ncbi:hypothetical protein [Mycolicibacterium conceptionense]|uniref:hypothetical protein n=1 Tax=Mycolicibacterium conceptionense TaxID=451644 RepID=UPI00096E101F|nr:hypothetical protein [Mycolicibacterium conceptionense]OMB79238.1 hypothetical protein A5743_14125 [Mycolicibacterium conceptionense]
MALTFKVAGLIQLLDDCTTAHYAAVDKYKQDCTAAREAYTAEWWSENRENVRALRDYLTKSLKNNTPPLHSEARKILGQNTRYRDEINLFIPGGDSNVSKNSAAYYRMDEIAGLSSLLKAHQGETVTAYQLKELGTHPKDLEKLFRVAVEAGVAVSR